MAAAFSSYPSSAQPGLRALRQLIFDTAASTEGVGAVEETLKWGQPAYLTSETGSGSTIRLAPTGAKSPHDYAMYFICNTNLVETFKDLFGDTFEYDGKRALLFSNGAPVPEDELQACVMMALTYHLAKA